MGCSEEIMKAVNRTVREAELLEMRANDPLQVIALYRRIVGLNQRSMLPGGMDLASLVESILDHETACGRLLDQAL
jgi:hypothetical protein